MLYWQTWNGKECEGQLSGLILRKYKKLKQANEQLGDGWRLPTKIELEGLFVKNVREVIKLIAVFPSTPAEPFWTSDKIKWSSNRFWTVNFFTGYSFSRFTASKPLASRFVKIVRILFFFKFPKNKFYNKTQNSKDHYCNSYIPSCNK